MTRARTRKSGRLRAPFALAILFLFLSNLVTLGAGFSADASAERNDRGSDVSIGVGYCAAPTSDAGQAPARRHLHHDCVLCSTTCQPALKIFVLPGERVVFVSPGESSRRAWLFRSDLACAPPAWTNYWSSRAPPSVS